MKNKTLITSHKKKSIASLFLALLLMFSFNSTPMVLLANNMRKTNAYKPTETQTYYSNIASELEKNFSDGKYPSSLEKYFDGSTKNFNVYNYYTAKFEENYKTIIEPFFKNWGTYGGSSDSYSTKLSTLFAHYGVETLSELYTSLQSGDYLKELATEKNYSVSSFQDFIELFALYGLPEYSSDASMPEILSEFATNATLDTCTKLSKFYRLVRSYTYSDGHGYDSFADDEGGNSEISSRDAFYKNNTHYVAISNKIIEEIKKNAPAYIFDNELQDTNIAAIFANNAPLSLNYNYTGSYTTYTTPNITYATEPDSNVKYRAVYYWGDQSDVSRNDYYITHSPVWKISSEADKAAAEKDMIFYRPILEGEDGYVEGKTTYYKVNSLNYVTTYNKIYTIYVLNNNPTQNELDTYSAMYFTPISQSDLDADMEKTYDSASGTYSYNNPDDRYYINIPYEEDQLYFNCIYNNYLFSKSFDFDSFVDYFTYKDGGKTVSKLYIKCKPLSNPRNVVFIEENKLEEFKNAYPDYTNEVRTFRQADFIENDYELITQNSSNSGYLPTSSSEPLTFKLYFQKVKEDYTNGVTSSYSGYEQEKDVIKNLTQTTIASSAYELEDSGKRALYVLDNGVDLSSTSFDNDHKIKQSEIDANPNYYVPALASEYESLNLDSTIYNLYYKHTSTTTDEIYVVDDSSNASENPIYKTLNYKVITSTEYKNNYSNYLLVAEGDVNYNENFLLYYKYERTANTSKYYVLRDDIASVDANKVNSSKYQFNYVGSGELSDYILMEENENSDTQTKYKTVRNSFFGNDGNGGETLHLYYKKTDVFVQNELKNGNAIYVVDSSLGSGERETYSANYWTVITKTDVSNNPELYVQITEKDVNYSEGYTLYYRYIESSATHNKVYSIEDIDKTATNFNANDYELITSSNQYGYIQNSELYYKKIVTSSEDIKVSQNSFYYYQTSSTVTLSSNSYYAISFYVFTTNDEGDNAKASFIVKDTAGIMSDIKLENISTNGTWQQYYIFISTDTATSSTINLYLYLGDEEHGIKGNNESATPINGAVFFDDIEITKIGVTDYNKHAISNELIYSTPLTTGEGDSKVNVEGCYADKHNNQIFIANEEAVRTDEHKRFENNIYDYKNLLNNSSATGDYKGYTWNDMFDFNNASADLKKMLGFYSASTEEGVESTVINNQLLATLGSKDTTHNRYNITGYDMYNLYTESGTINSSNDLFPTLWRYYVSRDLGRDGLSLDKYLNAYAKGDLEVSITNKIEETKVNEDDEDEKDKDDDDKKDADDIVYVSEPFNINNYALKLKNKNNDISLGITSNAFTIQQFGYYKITVWIYSPDKDGTATLTLNSLAYGASANQQGSLLTTTISSANANVANSTSKSDEYGWIPVTFYVEGNARRDMQCYLVLSADNNSTVYFDNITIEKITSKLYDSNTSSSAYSGALSLTPSATYDKTGIKNGNFDYVIETNASITNSVNTITPRSADNWTELSTNSKRVIAGVVSTKNQNEFFDRYVGGCIPYEIYSSSYQDDFSNIYAIYAPKQVETILKDSEGNPIKADYSHNYSIYSGSLSLSSSTLYEISFKFYADSTFSGNLVSNIYLSSVKTANIFASMKETQSDNEKWKTYTYYISTGTSSQTVYLEIGVENAAGTCYFKNVSSTKVSTGETLDEIIARVAKDNNITGGSTTDIYNAIKNVRFIDMADMDFSYHEPNENETGLFEQKVFTNNTETTDDHTSGKTGVVVANYFDTVQTTTYSVTINKTTYYIGEVYKVNYNDNDYFVHKTYNSKSNAYEYKLYSDTELTQEITQIDSQDVIIEATSTGINVSVGSVSVEQSNITTTYRLYKYSDLREEVTEIDGSEVKVENLNKVVVGTGSKATENSTTTETNTSYIYHFGSNDLEFNNTIIPSSELVNNQSGNVLILANGYSTDYITLTQTTTRTIGKSTYNVLRIYVKTSNFSSEDFGLNIEIDAINVKWENINTTKLTDEADNYGFVCYEVLISTNSTDSVSNFAVKLSLGSEDDLGYGYAIISDISLETFSSKEAFEHYSDVAGEKETVKRKLYEETSSSSSSNDEEPDDKNSVSWATFFYIFSSILLVVTMVIAMVALVLKKHPIKFAKKYANEHDRDIDSLTTKKTTISTNSSDSLYGADSKEKRNMKDKNNSGGII